MKLITKKTAKYESVFETDDSYGEYRIFDKDTYYIFGFIRIWSRNYNFEDRPITEWIKKCLSDV